MRVAAKKVQRFLTLGAFTLTHLWQSMLCVFLTEQMAEQATVYVAIDRTTWREVNLLMASVIWRGRAIPLYWQLMENLGNSDYTEQTELLSKALPMLWADKIIVLGDREFCSVDLAGWLCEQGYYFCLRQKKSTWMKAADDDWKKLSMLGLQPGTQCFYNTLTLTKSKGFSAARLVGKWKRRYRGFAPEEPWFILTNLDTLDEAIRADQKRFDIEEMFRDLKLGGYSLERCRAQGKRFLAIVLLIAIAYTCVTSQGQTLKQKALQKYIARPERYDQPYRRHSAFHVGLAAHRWVPFWPRCQQQVFELLALDRNKLPYHLKELKAMDAVLSTF
ncbi:MAG: IS4 family transposase [Cyanobacteria bacterium J06626_6]